VAIPTFSHPLHPALAAIGHDTPTTIHTTATLLSNFIIISFI
jgi:hypothetical protein